jgi:integrase/recombinase XerD
MPTDSFPLLLQHFFGHLRTAQEVSAHTIAAYRDTLRLLLHFIAKRRHISIDQITLDVFCPDIILAFLEHLQKERHNTTRTRNARLGAIRAFVRFCLGEVAPDFIASAQRILAIPSKRCDKLLLGFLTRQEVEAILAATDLSTWTGRRDHLLFSLLYNTGARISEALQLKPSDVQSRVVQLHGKGRKKREIPIWHQTHHEIQRWCRDNQIPDSQPIFGNRDHRPLSRRGAALRFALTLKKAADACPSLQRRKISLHTWRHTCAMHLLQAGVPIEIIALWLGHEQISTTHGYLEADLKMKKQILAHLGAPTPWRRAPKAASSHTLAFLESL